MGPFTRGKIATLTLPLTLALTLALTLTQGLTWRLSPDAVFAPSRAALGRMVDEAVVKRGSQRQNTFMGVDHAVVCLAVVLININPTLTPTLTLTLTLGVHG